MDWTIEITSKVEKQVRKMDRLIQRRIVRFLRERLATPEDPRRMGKALQGEQGELWRYRVGDFRLIGQIQDERPVVLVVAIGHRSEAYR